MPSPASTSQIAQNDALPESIKKAKRYSRYFGIVALTLFLISGIINLSNNDNPSQNTSWKKPFPWGGWWKDVTLNLGANFAGAAVVTFTINCVVAVVAQRERDWKIRQEALVEELRLASPGNRQALINKIKSEGLFKEANLARINLDGMNLEDIDFTLADLREAELRGVRAKGARFIRAQLSGCKFGFNKEKSTSDGHGERSDLQGVYFTGASMRSVDLQGANLEYSKFQGAYIAGSRMEDANLTKAEFDYTTKYHDDVTKPQKYKIPHPLLNTRTTMPSPPEWDGKKDTLETRYGVKPHALG